MVVSKRQLAYQKRDVFRKKKTTQLGVCWTIMSWRSK